MPMFCLLRVRVRVSAIRASATAIRARDSLPPRNARPYMAPPVGVSTPGGPWTDE
jgi:hypothetical protein